MPLLSGTLDELLADDVMETVLRTAGHERDEFRDMLKEMAATRSRLWMLQEGLAVTEYWLTKEPCSRYHEPDDVSPSEMQVCAR